MTKNGEEQVLPMSMVQGYNLKDTLAMLYLPDWSPVAEFSTTRLYYMISRWNFDCTINRWEDDTILNLGKMTQPTPFEELINW